jgi:peptide/nickel transport system substrate-binding protein
MIRRSIKHPVIHLVAVLAIGLVACAPNDAGPSDRQDSSRQRPRSVTIGVTSAVDAMSNMGGTTSVGGWVSVSEVHSNALVTSDYDTRRPVGRLAQRLPTLEDGSIALLADGRMRVVYNLRQDVLWHDGARFTADDLLFSFRFNREAGIPNPHTTDVSLMDSAEAPDPYTFVVYFTEPYYRANALGIRSFWPHPKHLLGEAYERYLATRNADEIINLPYWTSEYVHTGPFRLTSFDPSGDIVFQAFDQYFLGRPKLDTIRVRLFLDEGTLFSNLLAGTVDLLMESTIHPEQGFQLKDRWESTGEGLVPVKNIGQRFLGSQWRAAYQIEPTNLDPRVRAALYHALDRETLSEGLQSGHGELAASELLTPGSLFYEETKGTFRRYAYDPDRARALLREAGWTPGADGFLQHSSDGRRFRNSITATAGRIEQETPAFADYWRRIGMEVEERVVPPAFVRDRAYRAQYPGWEASSSAGGDGIFRRWEAPAATAENRWIGNRDGYENPRAQQLLRGYWTSISEPDQLRSLQSINDFAAAELPILVLFTTADHIAVRRGVKALDDHAGGEGGGGTYGTYSRNAHLWSVD